MVPNILPLIPKHEIYCEPFLGGAAVFFAKNRSAVEVINDKNEFVINFFKVAQLQYPELEDKIKTTLHSSVCFAKAAKIFKDPSSHSAVDKAWAFWVISTMSFIDMGRQFIYAKNGDNRSRNIRNKRDSFTELIQRRLEETTIHCEDAIKLIKRYDSNIFFAYLDPPYINTCQNIYSGYTEENYIELLDYLVNMKGKFLLSSFPNDILTKYVEKHNWGIKSFVMTKSITNIQNLGESKKELLVFNYNTYCLPMTLF